MIMIQESDVARITTLLEQLYEFTGWDEARYLRDRLMLAHKGYPVGEETTPSNGDTLEHVVQRNNPSER